MRLERSATQKLECDRTAIFPHLVVYAAKEVGDYLVGGHRGVAKYGAPDYDRTYAALTREYAQVPVGGEE